MLRLSFGLVLVAANHSNPKVLQVDNWSPQQAIEEPRHISSLQSKVNTLNCCGLSLGLQTGDDPLLKKFVGSLYS